MTKDYFKKLEEGIQVQLPTDADGFVGRECPNPACLGRFMIKFGTGLKGENVPCTCPYCGHQAQHDQFFTKEQIAYLQSVFNSEVTNAVQSMAQDWDRQLKQQTRGGFVQMSVDFKSQHRPIRYYEEKGLETQVICTICTLAYKIYGEFAYCPDCGTHNSLQILQKNLELVSKQLSLATEQDPVFAEYLTRDALENCVSAFDGFGRELVRINASKSNNPSSAAGLSFQNLDGAQKNLLRLFGIDLAAGVSTADWDNVSRAFQKRHVLAHRMGVADTAYVQKANDPNAEEGRKVRVDENEVRLLTSQLEQLAQHLNLELQRLP